jgi:hypothetical protein
MLRVLAILTVTTAMGAGRLPTVNVRAAGPEAVSDNGPAWFADEVTATHWTDGALSVGRWTCDAPEQADAALDPALLPVQFMAPTTQSPLVRQPTQISTNSNRSALRAGAAAAGIASVPYMIGDTGAGTCIGFSGILDAMLSHPTLACGRLNIAEANTPRVTDRFYYSYRHFNNTSMVSAFQFGQTLDVERHTLGWENSFWDRTGSLELRVPIDERMQSDVFSILAPNFGVVDPLVGANGGRRAELGNISAILKLAIVERQDFYLSGGVGVTLPTAQDVDYHLAVSGVVDYPSSPGLQADMNAAFETVFANETIYIEPFAAWLYAPTQSRWFHQGFFQVEVAANPSRVTFNGTAANDFYQNGSFVGFYDYFTPTPVRANLLAQTLMRLNLGVGYRMYTEPEARWLRQLTAMFEMHYTSTLNDAALTNLPLATQASGGTVPLQTIAIGNQLNRVDILNAATGISGQLGNWVLTNGFVAPVRSAPDRGFDFEYNMQAQRAF